MIISVYVGKVQSSNSGLANDDRRLVEFTGEELATHKQFGTDERGNITDTRGVTQTLYKTDDGRLIVHQDVWSLWQGEPSIETLHEADRADFEPGGRFEGLASEAGYQRALTLDEALEWGG